MPPIVWIALHKGEDERRAEIHDALPTVASVRACTELLERNGTHSFQCSHGCDPARL